MEASAEAFTPKLFYWWPVSGQVGAQSWLRRWQKQLLEFKPRPAQSDVRLLHSLFVPFRKRSNAEAARGLENIPRLWRAGLGADEIETHRISAPRPTEPLLACCFACICCPGLRQKQHRSKSQLMRNDRDKISNKIARDFSFGPLVKIPSSADRATAGTVVVFQDRNMKTLKFRDKLWSTQK